MNDYYMPFSILALALVLVQYSNISMSILLYIILLFLKIKFNIYTGGKIQACILDYRIFSHYILYLFIYIKKFKYLFSSQSLLYSKHNCNIILLYIYYCKIMHDIAEILLMLALNTNQSINNVKSEKILSCICMNFIFNRTPKIYK